jgi:hypothetical protein
VSRGVLHKVYLLKCLGTVVDSIRLKTGLNLTQIYEREVKRHATAATRISYRSFVEWHATGSKYIAIACGGSIYALVLIAGLGLRVSIALLT